jgi:hypothetical protein
MDTFNLYHFIALLLISKIESFQNSYSLFRVLEWKFKIVEVNAIMEQLEEKRLISKVSKNSMNTYSVTEKGKDYVKVNFEIGKKMLTEKYEMEKDFLIAVFSN